MSDVTLQVDFIWINRDQKSFEWFVSLLTKLEMDQADEEPEGERETLNKQREREREWTTSAESLLSLLRPLPGDAHVHDVSSQ